MYEAQIRIAIAGTGGRVGRQLIQATMAIEGIQLGAASECEGSSLLESNAGELVGAGKTGVTIQGSLDAVKDDLGVFVDFTRPEDMPAHLAFCHQYGKGMMIGTTGFDDIGKQAIRDTAQRIAVVSVVDFSVGVNVMFKLLEGVAKVMGDYTDTEIIGAHHHHKVDTPLGTTLAMGGAIAETLDKDLKGCAVYSCKGHTGGHISSTVGFATVRTGDIVSEYIAMLTDIGECIEIVHKAPNYMIFTNGVMRLAIWLKSKSNGLFDMKNVLDLRSL